MPKENKELKEILKTSEGTIQKIIEEADKNYEEGLENSIEDEKALIDSAYTVEDTVDDSQVIETYPVEDADAYEDIITEMEQADREFEEDVASILLEDSIPINTQNN